MSTWAWIGIGVARLPRRRRRSTTSRRRSTRSCATSRSSATSATGSRRSAPSCGSTSSPRNDEERPFSRDQRRWVYASSKKENNYFGVRHRQRPRAPRLHPRPPQRVPAAHAARRRARLRPELPAAVRARARRLPRPQARVPAGLDRQHLGDELRLAVGRRGRGDQPRRRARRRAAEHRRRRHLAITTASGGEHHLADRHRLLRLPRRRTGGSRWSACSRRVASAKVRAIEIKLSQGAKPGLGGVLPAAKITPEIARIRGIPLGQDCISPANHTAFTDVSSMLDFIERLADATGLPVGIKSAVGDLGFWRELADADRQDQARARLHHDRRRRRRHRRRAARVHRPRRAAVQARLRRRSTGCSPRPACSTRRRVHRLGQARLPRDRRCSRSRSAAT